MESAFEDPQAGARDFLKMPMTLLMRRSILSNSQYRASGLKYPKMNKLERPNRTSASKPPPITKNVFIWPEIAMVMNPMMQMTNTAAK